MGTHKTTATIKDVVAHVDNGHKTVDFNLPALAQGYIDHPDRASTGETVALATGYLHERKRNQRLTLIAAALIAKLDRHNFSAQEIEDLRVTIG